MKTAQPQINKQKKIKKIFLRFLKKKKKSNVSDNIYFFWVKPCSEKGIFFNAYHQV